MSEIRINLSLILPGSVLLSEQECLENPKESYDENKLLIKYTKGKGKNQKVVKQLVNFSTRKTKVATQSINICEEAYDYMVETAPTAKLAKVWKTMSIKDRLKEHFDLIAHDLGAISYSFEIIRK